MRFQTAKRHCEERSNEAIHSSLTAKWIVSPSLSSGAHFRDPLVRNDGILIATTNSRSRRAMRPSFA
jgi:hypothetical protein